MKCPTCNHELVRGWIKPGLAIEAKEDRTIVTLSPPFFGCTFIFQLNKDERLKFAKFLFPFGED